MLRIEGLVFDDYGEHCRRTSCSSLGRRPLGGELFSIVCKRTLIISKHLEATLFCIKAAHEALSSGENTRLGMVFGEEVLGRLPLKGEIRLRRTVLALIGMSGQYQWRKRTKPSE